MTADDGRPLVWIGWASGLFAVLSTLLFGLALGFDPRAGTDLVERLVRAEQGDAELVRWGALTDMLGYYLLPAVLAILVRERLPRGPLLDLATVAGVVYGTAGGLAAVVLATAGPPLIEGASASDSATLETLGYAVQGVWQWFDPLPFTLWVAGLALSLRAARPAYANLFWVMAGGGILVWLGRVAELEPVLIAGLALWLAPFPAAMALASRWSGRTT